MAGDWIKMRVSLPDDPAVIGMAAALDMDEFAVVGRLHALWSWADVQSRDGHAHGVTAAWINRKVQRDGFAEAMVTVGWLEIGEGGVCFPKFDLHNGDSAKTRALGANRKQKQRASSTGHADGHDGVAPVSRTQRDESVTREEKRREESSTSLRSVAAARATRKCPESFELTAELQAWAAEHVPGVDLQRETAKLRDHTFKTAHSDWPGAWRNWMRRAAEDLAKRGSSAAAESFRERDTRLAAERTAEFAPGIARRVVGAAHPITTLDMELPDVLAIGRS